MGEKLKLVDEISVKPDGWREDVGEGYQGSEGYKYYIYALPNSLGFIKVVTQTDSYDSNEKLAGVQMVQPKEKTVVVYE